MSIDLKDRPSNNSILSILTRSYSRTTPLNDNCNIDRSNHINNDNSSSSGNKDSNRHISSSTNTTVNSMSNGTANSYKVTPTSSTIKSKDPSQQKQQLKINGKDLINEPQKVSTLFSRFSITSSITNLNPRPKILGKRISKGPGSNIYQIGAEIGRGGFAVVYQAFNVETGDFVALKRIPLSAVDDSALSIIQGEIELMRRLNHPHIVEYYETIRTEGYLNIVLEYIENGSLLAVLKKFGSFNESLVAIYVTQILKGLKYLHEQGVMHRDIKGANILTTKDGFVKLADFGVAMRLSKKSPKDSTNETKSRSSSESPTPDVAGSPYWIAPEIIEMSTPTTACDIWSVGCTVIELLTGKPPYFSKPPMAALFSIVQDEYPPLPDGLSSDLKDFLLQCFQKEPTLRITASALLNHRWLVAGQALSAARTATPRSSSMSDDESIEDDYTSLNIEEDQIRFNQYEVRRRVDDKFGSENGSRGDGKGTLSCEENIRKLERSYRRNRLRNETKSAEMNEGSSRQVDMQTSGMQSVLRNSDGSPNYMSDREILRNQDRDRELEREKEREKDRVVQMLMMMEKKKEKEKQWEPLSLPQFITSRPTSVSRELSDKLSDRVCQKPSSFAESIDSAEADLFGT